VITCPKCSKDNQDHYKFCLGCGAELPKDAAPKPFSPQTPPQGMKSVQAAPAPTPPIAPAAVSWGAALGATMAVTPSAPPPRVAVSAPAPVVAPPPAPQPPAPQVLPAPAPPPAPVAAPSPGPSATVALSAVAAAAAAAAPGATIICPQCGHVNAPHLFCGSCGFRLGAVAPRPVAAAPPPAEPAAGAMALTALRADGTEAGTFQMPTGGGTIGRETGGVFAGDSYLSPRHATFRVLGGGRATVKDEGSLNGVYKKLTREVPVEIRPNDVFRIGQEIIKFEPLAMQAPSPDGVERLGAPSKGYIGRIALVVGREETGNAFPIPENGVHLGRERGDILFPEDGYVSGLHCRLSWENQKLFLTDLGSSNGTFVRVGGADLRSGDVLLMGQQLFRIGL
jgi:pSer/pThr/pTyr-binding forkhead associated (FHA) protein